MYNEKDVYKLPPTDRRDKRYFVTFAQLDWPTLVRLVVHVDRDEQRAANVLEHRLLLDNVRKDLARKPAVIVWGEPNL